MVPDPAVLGLDVGGTRIRAALAHGEAVLLTADVPWPQGLAPRQELGLVADIALSLVSQSGMASSLRAAGVALAALTDREGCVIEWPNRPGWKGLAFRALMEERLQVPTVVEDDANAAALAEWTLGRGRGFRHGLVLMVGTGVGAGLILDGRLYHGHHGWAGEIGHMVVQPEGPACGCGRRGCVQSLASGRALERWARTQGLASGADVELAAAKGEAWALEALADAASWLGLGVANAVNLLDREAVIVGGGVSALGEAWWGPFERALRGHLMNAETRSLAVLRAALPETAGLFGALGLARERAGLTLLAETRAS
jgi:glucokinase